MRVSAPLSLILSHSACLSPNQPDAALAQKARPDLRLHASSLDGKNPAVSRLVLQLCFRSFDFLNGTDSLEIVGGFSCGRALCEVRRGAGDSDGLQPQSTWRFNIAGGLTAILMLVQDRIAALAAGGEREKTLSSCCGLCFSNGLVAL